MQCSAVQCSAVQKGVGTGVRGAIGGDPSLLMIFPIQHVRHYTTLHYTTVHYTTLHYTTLHYTTHLLLLNPILVVEVAGSAHLPNLT